MGRKKSMSESANGRSLPEGSNDLQSKIVNKNEHDMKVNNTNGLSALNINVDQETKEENCHKDGETTLAAEVAASCSRPRRRFNQVSYCPPRSPSPESRPISSAKKLKLRKNKVDNENIEVGEEMDELSRDSNITNFEDSTDNENYERNINDNNSSTPIALDKLKFDIEIDPNIVDRYTDSGFTAEESIPESPETRRQRIDIISRQCRLHPANKKYNQGPVENPPLITPGTLVGYTPGGQRHEVDLNFDRPTWFNSEYARMQWDCATRVNVSRMFHQLETGTFLPDGLDPNIERKYFAEQEMATNLATEHFEGIVNASSSHAYGQSVSSDLTEEEKEHLQLLEAENELIDLNKYAVVTFEDFAGEIDRKLRKALDLTLTPLMIKKNPLILDTLETLATQCVHIEVVLSARALLDKIKGLFQVPENQEFREFFAEEVEKLKEKTKDMTGFDILMMTEEPPYSSGDEVSVPDTVSVSDLPVGVEDSNEAEDDWVPVENGDIWVDVSDSNHDGSDDSYVEVTDASEDDYIELSSDDESDDLSADESNSDEEFEMNWLGTLVSGMLNSGGYTRYTLTITFNYFEYI